MALNKCIYCGNPLPDQATFCTQCGRPLYTNNQPQQPQQQQPAQQQYQQPTQQYQQPVQQQYQQPVQQQYSQQQYQQTAQAPQPQGQYPSQPQQPASPYPNQYQTQGQPQQPAGPYPPQGQYPQQPQPTNDPGKGGNKLWLIVLLVGLLIAAAAAGGWWYWKNAQKEDVAEIEPVDSTINVIDSTELTIDSTELEPEMQAPVITIDDSGMISVDECPTTYEGLDVKLNKSEGMIKAVNIYRNGEIMQTLNLKDINYYDGADLVHFVDANFDGYVDMMIGVGCARNYSGLFLWDKDNKKFVRASENGDKELNADYFFVPKEKAVYASYSQGGGMSQTSKLEWDGKDMHTVESFYQMESWRYHEFPELNITHHYNVVNRNNNRIIFSTDDPNAVPARWRKWVYEEYSYENPEPGAPLE